MTPQSLTTEQRLAIATRDVSVALSAGAGCGKTFVLTERFISHLERAAIVGDAAQPAELRQLIAITFTDAAAREMRSRIRDKCYERLQSAASDKDRDHWQRLIREIDTARISTIHSFCTALLRAHATEAGLDPTFGVLDQGDADVLQSEVIDDVLRERLAALDDEVLDLAAAFGLSRLKQQISVLLNERLHDYFQTWQAATAREIADCWQEWHAREAIPNALREIAATAPVDKLLALLVDFVPQKPAFRDARDRLLDMLPKLAAAQLGERELIDVRELARVQGVCTAKDWPDADAFAQYRDACKELRALVDEHRPSAFERPIAEEAARFGLALLQLAAKIAASYTDRKAALGQLDFDDLLMKAYELVSHPQNASLRERLAGDLRLLLVDEFQDTDQLQVDLVKAICGPGIDAGRLFFVGDFKQSIYRFRGAAPRVFRDLRADLAEQGRLPLNVNFRSQGAVLDFINALFHQAFNRDGEQYEPLRPNRPQITAPPAVEFLWTIAPDKDNRVKGTAEAARREEARAIARRLRMLIDSTEERPIVDEQTDQPRPVQLGDIAILFRALSDVHLYEEALREYDLPYYLVGGHAFYAQQEVYDVLNLLRAVASTADELSLAGVLRSPFFSLEDETLFWLVESAGSLNDGLMAEQPPVELTDIERDKVIAASDTIRKLRSLKDRVSIAVLLGKALDLTGYDAVLLGEFLGERKLANLRKLSERARTADSGVVDLDGFITQLAQFISQQPKEALAATLPETAGVIRLMTIHHAKGLEFPLVVLPDLDRPPHVSTPSAALHRDLGPLVPWPVDEERTVTTGMSLFAAMERHEELEERKRLLYVACTRAADYLLLSSSLASHEKPKSDWMKLLAERFNLHTGRLNSELPPGYIEPDVRVTSEPHTDHRPVGKSRGPDLLALLNEAQQLAAEGGGTVPRAAQAIDVDTAARRLFTVSQFTGQLMAAEPEYDQQSDEAIALPATDEADGRGLGNLVHAVLSRIDFGDKPDLAGWCRHLASYYVPFGHENVSERAAEMLLRFATSPRAKQLAQARAVHRETEFLLAWPPGDAPNSTPYFRGFIDCLYQDSGGGWHLVDYKTNHVEAANVSRIAQRYELQMHVYALAAERVLGQSPVELTLYFLHPGEEHNIPWNDTVRRQAIVQVNQKIGQLLSEPRTSNPEP